MYRFLKKALFLLLPHSWIYRFEDVFRYVFSWLFAGSNVMCNLCGGHFSRFVYPDGQDAFCPRCGSRSRHRRLWMIFQEMHRADPDSDVLHFSPSRMVSRRMKQIAGQRYQTSALDPEERADHQYDLTVAGSVAGSFDLVICYHVLEHIEKDRQAMSELFRILRPGGTLLLQTPLKEGDTYENESIRSPEARSIHFGQEDHVRIYAASGLTERLTDTGFQVGVVSHDADRYYGLKENEMVFYCRKVNFVGNVHP